MHTFRAMNTVIVTDGLPGPHQTGCEEWFDYAEQSLSRFLPDSELSRLNRSGNVPFRASRLLYEILSIAESHYHETAGLFNPYLGTLIASLGYEHSFELLQASTSIAPTGRFKLTSDGYCRLDNEKRTITLGIGTAVDLGGIAKGWAAHTFALSLQNEGIKRGAIGAGGDLAIWGEPSLMREIDIASPLDEERDLLTLAVWGTLGIATSSSAKRRWVDSSGRTHHHILDPRSGSEAESDLLQVTLLAPNLLQAEIYAKCLLILGERSGMRWLYERHPDCAAILVRQDGSWTGCGNMSRYTERGGADHERVG
jgi:thiamine biosynthesis lipoprotein